MISFSIVTYNTNEDDLDKVYNSIVLTQLEWILYIIDNSPTDTLRKFADRDQRIVYIHNDANIGFGAAHNIAIKASLSASVDYHFIVNPDIYFYEDVATPMVKYMSENEGVGMMMPEVRYPNDEIQNLPKLIPAFSWVFYRKIRRPSGLYHKFINKYELRNIPKSMIYNAPILSGCFTLLNMRVISELGGYDDRYFMYFEDFDLSRKVNEKYQTLYFPKVTVFHGYDSGANKSSRLFKIFVKSAISYFTKWGWLFDRKRIHQNKKTLQQFDNINILK